MEGSRKMFYFCYGDGTKRIVIAGRPLLGALGEVSFYC